GVGRGSNDLVGFCVTRQWQRLWHRSVTISAESSLLLRRFFHLLPESVLPTIDPHVGR
ncbi:unnamed protein product, partial [Musa acuminata subsp. burmannicoides]